MKHRDAFSACHPLVNFIYFTLVLGFTMFITHPAVTALSLGCALCYAVRLKGRRAARLALAYMLPMALIAAVAGPAFSHEGATILAYLPTGNPLTLESILYGLSAAVLMCAVVAWFYCLTEVISSDKLIYLFGRIIPALSLVLSMTLRFVPRFIAQLRVVSDARRCVGRDVSSGTLIQRIRSAVSVFSIMVTWSLENAIDTADSMKSRGYGLPGRTAFSIYRFDGRDRALLLWLGFCGFYLACGWAAGGLYWRWFPTVKAAELTPFSVSFQLVFLLLCLTSVFLDRMEDAVWKRLNCEN